VFGRIVLIADATPAAEQASETFKEINRSTDSKNSHRGVETEPPTRKEQTEMPEQTFIEKWARFLLVDGKWDVQTWPDQVTAGCKLYRLRIPFPPNSLAAMWLPRLRTIPVANLPEQPTKRSSPR
jgi:hypothetical protein